MTIVVGEVVAVNGTKISLKIFEESNREVLFYKGEQYKGVSIREYISIQRGFRKIVCLVEGEYLDEKKSEIDGVRVDFTRRVDVRPVGYFESGKFLQGIKFMPMIKDQAQLLNEEQISTIFTKPDAGVAVVIGKLLKEGIEVGLPWRRLFNTHIGIFGNTGSGKSNTLAKLYTALFEKKYASIEGVSRFVIIDFNGEYTGAQLVPRASKTVYDLNTRVDNGDKFKLQESEFWSAETLALLFQATPNTQQPFLNRLVLGRARYANNADSLTRYAHSSFRKAI